LRKLLTYCLFLIQISTYAQFEWKFEAGYEVSDTGWMIPHPYPAPTDIAGNYLSLDSSYKPSVREHALGDILNDNEIYIYGGQNRNYLSDSDLWIYDISQSKWAFVKHYNTIQTIDVVNGESSNNSPGRLNRAASAFDENGNLWVFGGLKSVNEESNALWSLNSKTHQWTYWEIPNGPIARFRARGWVHDNKFWIYGGVYDNSWGIYALNDLWYLDLTTMAWNFVKGNKNVSFPADNQCSPTNGSYPDSIRVKGPSYFPRSRSDYGYWIDQNGDFWLYGGFLSTHGQDNFSDLWKFHTGDLEWELIEGTDALNEVRTDSTPGSRNAPFCWVDANGKLMLYGGATYGDKFLSDMWQYDPVLYQWDSIRINNTVNTIPKLDPTGVQWPGAQVCNLSHITTKNFTYMFNSYGYGTNGQAGFTGALWKYPIRNIDSLDIPKISNLRVVSNKGYSTMHFCAIQNGTIVYQTWTNVDINPNLAGFQDTLKTASGLYKISKLGHLTFKLDSISINQITSDTSYFISDSLVFIALSGNGYFTNQTKAKFQQFPCDTNNYFTQIVSDSSYNTSINLGSSKGVKLNQKVNLQYDNPSAFVINSQRNVELLPGFEIAASSNGSAFIKPEGCPEIIPEKVPKDPTTK
jgi:hypothetical protein